MILVVNSSFIHDYKPSQKFFAIFKVELEIFLWNGFPMQHLIRCHQRDIYPAQTLWKPKILVKILPADLFDIFTAYTISNNFNLQSSRTIWWVFSTISELVTSTGHPEQGSLLLLVRPILNSATYFLNIEYGDAESCIVVFISSLIWLDVKLEVLNYSSFFQIFHFCINSKKVLI